MTTLSLPAAAIDEAAIRAFKATLCNSDGVYLTPARMREEIADTFAKLRAAAVEQPALGQQVGSGYMGNAGSHYPSAGPEQPVAAVPSENTTE